MFIDNVNVYLIKVCSIKLINYDGIHCKPKTTKIYQFSIGLVDNLIPQLLIINIISHTTIQKHQHLVIHNEK